MRQAPFAEQTIVHGGKQSMPLDYNNVKTPFYSEAEREFAPGRGLDGRRRRHAWSSTSAARPATTRPHCT